MFGVKNKTAIAAIGALVLLAVVVYFGLTAIPRATSVTANPNATSGVTKVAPTPNPTPAAVTAAATPTPTAEPARIGPPVEDREKSEVKILTEDDRSSGLRAVTGSWQTNWNRHTIDYGELLSGGPPRDGIPSIDSPQFVKPSQAEAWLAGNEPVIVLEIDGNARAYPLQILTWHEIVNDTVGEVPVAVTFCPLCNSAITFDRRFNGEVFEFGTSGLLRNSDLVMYDRTTETLWQQFTGEGIVGDLTGERLAIIPSSIISFADFKTAYPNGLVLSRETGFNRRYGENPYVGYDTIGSNPFLFKGPVDGRLAAMERVVTVSLDGVEAAYPSSILAETGVINDTQAGLELAVFHQPGTSSALGRRLIAEAEDVGATGVFDRQVDDQTLTFRRDGDKIIDIDVFIRYPSPPDFQLPVISVENYLGCCFGWNLNGQHTQA
ncbi:MAG: DUF3179 domain-containing protein [Chloroflexota bacterium]